MKELRVEHNENKKFSILFTNMEALTRDMAEKMRAEDPWLGSESAKELMPLIVWCENVQIPTRSEQITIGLEMGIQIAELETVRYRESPALHCLLGDLYQKFPDELGEGFKLMVERLKLGTGGEYLLDFGNRPATEITASLPSGGRDVGENIGAALDYLRSHNIATYLQFCRSARAYYHLDESLNLSGKNPTVFKRFIEPSTIAYLMPSVLKAHSHGSGCIPSEYHPPTGHLAGDYKAARTRLGFN